MVTVQHMCQRPILPPEPEAVTGVKTPVMLLDGSWEFRYGQGDWDMVELPCDMESRYASVPGEKQYEFRKKVTIPPEWKGKHVFLRMEGAGCQAQLFINGAFVRSHYGSFTMWDCDVTSFAVQGELDILLKTEDDKKGTCPYQTGGVIRSVKLFALPEAYLETVHIDTKWDGSYQDAQLCVMLGCHAGGGAVVKVQVLDAQGNIILKDSPVAFQNDAEEKTALFTITNPKKWDSEHPYLYTLRLEVERDNQVVETVSKSFGFRQVEIQGRALFVNGEPVKLRGVGRHEISPRCGKTVDDALTEQDVIAFKKANINFVRCAHYPHRELFLDLCDRYGLYVLSETAAAYVEDSVASTQNDPLYYDKYLNQFAEMLEAQRNHPSVILWGLGSDSTWGVNFRAEQAYAKAEDPNRPVLFNAPMSMGETDTPPDVWSVHYAAYNLDLAEYYDHMVIGHTHGSDDPPGYALGYGIDFNMPVLHDEFALPACYNRDQQKNDPAVREFWGESIRRFWDKMWQTEGVLGGSVWSAIDQVNIYDGGSDAMEWGLLDVWRREKPEYYHVKKAYAPVRMGLEPVLDSTGLTFPLENRFNHTNLKELTVDCKVNGTPISCELPSLKPREKGELVIPGTYDKGDVIEIAFLLDGQAVEEEKVIFGGRQIVEAAVSGSVSLTEEEDYVVVRSGDASFRFSKKSCLLDEAKVGDTVALAGGPFLSFTGIRLPDWEAGDLNAQIDGDRAEVILKGRYGHVAELTYTITITGNGAFETQYTIDALHMPMPRTVKANVGLDVGGLDELGVYYLAPDSFDTLSWERDALWTVYPADHIGRPVGSASKDGGKVPAFGEKPENSWMQDQVSYALYGKYDLPLRGTNDFRSMKHHIRHAELKNLEGVCVKALSDGKDSVRMEVAPNSEEMIDDRSPAVRYEGTWYAMEEKSGCFRDTETVSKTAGDYAEVTFEGTGIVWYGSTDMIHGCAAVSVDGVVKDPKISLYVDEVEKPGMSRGYEKRYGKMLYSVTGLPYGTHTLRIEVLGEKVPLSQDTCVSVDAFRVLSGKPGYVKFIVNNDYNYTRLVWGNYMKDAVRVGDGFTGCVRMQLGQDR